MPRQFNSLQKAFQGPQTGKDEANPSKNVLAKVRKIRSFRASAKQERRISNWPDTAVTRFGE